MIARVLHAALIEIRTLAFRPEICRHPEGHLEAIREIADVCHNLPGAITPRPPDEFDALVWTWQTSSGSQRRWLEAQFGELGIDYSWLDQAPHWPPPATSPATRPRWRSWQLPRDPGSFRSVNTQTLATLERQAHAIDRPTAKSPEWFLAHLDPDGRHILRPSRADETQFGPDGPQDLRQHRVLVRMRDGALVVTHSRLRESDVAALPAGLSWIERLLLAAVPRRRHERDYYLWTRDHKAADPNCPDCPPRPADAN